MRLTINSIHKTTIVSYNSGKRKKTILHPDDPLPLLKTKLWYNRRTNNSLKKIKEYLFILGKIAQYENKQLYFITITTLQHKTKFSDKDLLYKFKKFIQHRKDPYCCVVERQRETADIHYHIITTSSKPFDIPSNVKRLGKLFTNFNTNVFNVQLVDDVQGVVRYFYKYIKKPCPTWDKILEYDKRGILRPPYSSLYLCRTFTVGGGLGKEYKRLIGHFKHVTDSFADIIKVNNESVIFDTDFYTKYKYDEDLFNELNPQSELSTLQLNDEQENDFDGIEFDELD